MAVYESGNMNRMQMMEAVRRPQEMHRHSHHDEHTAVEEKTECISAKENTAAGLLDRLFHDGKPDSDILLIVALIYLLYKEKADLKLILALGYIIIGR